MQKQTDDQTTQSANKTTDQVRQGVTGHNVRYVLMASMVGSVVALVVVLFVFVT